MTLRRINWVAIGVTLLVLLNIGLMATIWLQRKDDGNSGDGGPKPGDNNPLATELGFDSAQRRAFDTLRAHHFALNQGYREQMRSLKDRYFNGIKTGNPPNDALAGQMAALEVRIDSATYAHFAQVRGLCTDRQKEIFDRTLSRIINAMGKPPRGQQPRRDGHAPNGPHDGPPQDGPHDGPPQDGPPHDGPPDDGPPPAHS